MCCTMLSWAAPCCTRHFVGCMLHVARGVLDALCCVFCCTLHMVLCQGRPVPASRRSSKRLACISSRRATGTCPRPVCEYHWACVRACVRACVSGRCMRPSYRVGRSARSFPSRAGVALGPVSAVPMLRPSRVAHARMMHLPCCVAVRRLLHAACAAHHIAECYVRRVCAFACSVAVLAVDPSSIISGGAPRAHSTIA